MPVVDSGGQIIVLDSAGYGSVVIDKSLSIIAPDGIYAGLTAATGSVVSIATAGVEVTLKGLTIATPSVGIAMSDGAKLNVENCEISGASGGINVQTAAKVTVAHSTIRDNIDGIRAGAGATVNITDSRVTNNSYQGIVINGGTTGTTVVNISDTVVTGSTYCIDNFADAGTTGVVIATRTTVTGCSYGFINEPNGSGTMTVTNSVAAKNGVGFRNTSGTFESLGNNTVRQNTTPTSGTITVVSPN